MADTATDSPTGSQEDVKKPDWPQTPDGTIDWETVFEHPETGIIPALSAAHSKEALHKGTYVVIRQLFTRKNDEIQVANFLKELDVILGDVGGSEDLPQMRASILNLLRRIKDGRIQKAAEYVANKKKEAAAGEKSARRKKKQDRDRRAGELEKQKSRRMWAIVAIGVLIVALAALALTLLLGGEEQPLEEEAKSRVEEFSKKQETAEERAIRNTPPPRPGLKLSAEGYPLGTVGKDDIKELGPVVMVLSPVSWSRNVGAGNAGRTILLPVLVITEQEKWTKICQQAPALTEAIGLALERVMAKTGDLSPDDLRRGGQAAMQLVNKRLGGVLVEDLYLLHDVDRELMTVAARCQIVKK